MSRLDESPADRELIGKYLQHAHTAREQIDDVCFAVGWEVYEDGNIRRLAELAVETTGMGNVADKITRHFINVTWVSKPIPPTKPTDEEMWGEGRI